MKEILKSIDERMKLNNELNYQILMSNIINNLEIDKDDKQILLLLLQNRDRNFVRINDNEEVYKNIKEYLSLIRPLELPLENLVRIGGKSDGGYVMFHGGGALSFSDIKALSLGVSEYSPWDLEMANLGAKVIEYDASIEKSPYKHENISFHKKFIADKNDDLHITLKQAILDNNLDESKNNILQCDIENSEWQMLENIDMSELEKYFSQIIFEFHGLNPEEFDGFEMRSKALKKINEKFTPIHAHLNNHGKIFYSKNLFFSTTLEVSYLRKDLANKFKQVFRKSAGKIANLDYPTFTPNPELELRFKEENEKR